MNTQKKYNPDLAVLTPQELAIQTWLAESGVSSVIDKNSKLQKYTEIAQEQYSTKRSQLTIRPYTYDLEIIRKKAQELGIPYHTLINSLLHNFATGKVNLSFQQ